jgi:tetratricopeptide (TPR) repeat protein
MKELIDLESDNYKALFLRAKAYQYKNELEKAQDDYKRALKIDPTNKIIQKCCLEVKKKLISKHSSNELLAKNNLSSSTLKRNSHVS